MQQRVKKHELVMRAFGEPGAYSRRRYYSRWRSEAVQAFVGPGRLRRLIDYGCGNGAISLPLAAQVDELVLYDPSPAALVAARDALPPDRAHHVTLLDSGIGEWRAKPADLVLCVGVLAHVVDPFETLAEVSALVAPGGSLVLELTDFGHPLGRAQVWFSQIRARVRRVGYSWNTLRAADVLARCDGLGLSLRGVYRYGLPCDPSGWFSEEALYRVGLAAFGAVEQPGIAAALTSERLYYLRRH